MRNELYILFEGGSWLYFHTNKDTTTEAYHEYRSVMERIGVNVDNMRDTKLELRRMYDGTIIDWDYRQEGEWLRM